MQMWNIGQKESHMPLPSSLGTDYKLDLVRSQVFLIIMQRVIRLNTSPVQKTFEAVFPGIAIVNIQHAYV